MEQLNGAAQPPIEYPTYAIRGTRYSLKFGLGAFYRLERMGLNPSNLKEEISAWKEQGKNIDLVLTLAAASLGTVQGDQFTALGLTPEQIADVIPENGFAQLAEAVTAALVKVRPTETKSQTQSAELAEAMGGTKPS